MSSDAQDRNLPASERKIRKAREEGQVARSRDLGHFLIVAGGIVVVMAASPWMTGWLLDMMATELRFGVAEVQDSARMAERLAGAIAKFLALTVPLGLVVAGVAALGAVVSGGWNWTMKALRPKFGKMNPVQGLGQLFSKDNLVQALKASVLAVILGLIGAIYLYRRLDAFPAVLGMALPAAVAQATDLIVAGVALLLLALGGFAAIDVPLQRHLLKSRLKMSHRELKDEHKEVEGNQEVKSKVKALMRENVKRRMIAAVPKADLVVMNPTHYAVALKYEEGRMNAPRVVAKGADLLALRIRDVAQAAKVPVLQAPMLARALYAHAELDREIPASLYAAVAQVLAYVYQLRAAMAGQAPMPGELPALHVPPELDPHHGKTPAETAETE
ncbi:MULTISPECIES: flagellar type III secretion system protein FlhB [Caldimonas]|jgi:flagellar biosynthetic protein FlhB|uniref:EscU/YscU/HrcU family type III secretion system export apparatus switch protein n=1 Tax=Caldimonas TaxID=196013 RepID=UPI000360CD2E|nr:flagellar type III secretion system protein FlhB [Caldimonas manganoxidans]GIX25728.1 MAG: flagellar biosynthesis protein FlhB [Caldimonas sp.]